MGIAMYRLGALKTQNWLNGWSHSEHYGSLKSCQLTELNFWKLRGLNGSVTKLSLREEGSSNRLFRPLMA